jgi:hypothetical protein
MLTRIFRYYNEKTDSYEIVEPELWQWRANYNDGTFIEQFDSQDRFHRIEEIDQKNLHNFVMRNIETKKGITLKFPKGANLIHFYQRGGQIGNVESSYTIYVFGYEIKAQKLIIAILPDGNLALIDDLLDLKLLSFNKRINL